MENDPHNSARLVKAGSMKPPGVMLTSTPSSSVCHFEGLPRIHCNVLKDQQNEGCPKGKSTVGPQSLSITIINWLAQASSAAGAAACRVRAAAAAAAASSSAAARTSRIRSPSATATR